MAVNVSVGSSAPDFVLVDTGGAEVRLSQYRGKLVHLVFNRGFS